MSTYNTPGVYIEEIASFPASIVAVPTAVPAFAGYTELDPGEVKRIESFKDYVRFFGGPDLRIKVTLDANRDPVSASVSDFRKHNMYHSVAAYFDNGGGPAYVSSAGVYPAGNQTQVAKAALKTAMEELYYFDEPTLLIVPEAHSLALSSTQYGDVIATMLRVCADIGDRFALIDAKVNSSTFGFSSFYTHIGNQNLSYGAAYYPGVTSGYTVSYTNGAGSFDPTKIHISFPGAATPPPAAFEKLLSNVITAVGPTQELTSSQVAAVLTYLGTQDFELEVSLPPSPLVAGAYCTVDNTRGVWKAPANVSLRAIKSLDRKLTNDENGALNMPTNGKAINAIRNFSGKGNLLWGARTLDGNSGEWRYIPVRRLFMMVEESVFKATEPLVFEPNTANTWLKVKVMIENFLIGLWRDGALAGGKPEEAFFVNCGLGTTMTAQDIIEGKLIVEIGMAAVRPAEFIVLKFSHFVQEN